MPALVDRARPVTVPPPRGIYCNRTLNFRALRAIGYDMDYTLVDYRAEVFERRVYDLALGALVAEGWPVEDLAFDPGMVVRGLVIDTELGNLVKANRFGFVKRAMHGTSPLDFPAQREHYAHETVNLRNSRWVFLNTLFSLSEGCLYAQLVDLRDQGRLPESLDYAHLYRRVRAKVDAQHLEGRLKAEIAAAPEAFVAPDPEAALALQDQRASGKLLMLITNSEWSYTSRMMTHAYDPHLPVGQTWRDLFDLVIVGARKPEFFTGHGPFFEVATEEGLLRPLQGPLQPGGAYMGGSAAQVEQDLGFAGDQILYVGDHMFGDVNVSKRELRWRTALVLRELEEEVAALASFAGTEALLAAKMEEKERLEARLSRLRLEVQRRRGGYGPPLEPGAGAPEAAMQDLRTRLLALDAEIGPLAQAGNELVSPRWGLLTRAGNDKSHLARQVERYADVYTSRVSNFLHATPYAYFRSPRGSLPHDPGAPGGPPLAPVLGTDLDPA
ncbi:MAG: HAD-IG family 5'-nucleotidase [Acidobacteria bacterium]|nr:HAD-IG family 5'-nucleotidase [Acidobacteriota bacterium]